MADILSLSKARKAKAKAEKAVQATENRVKFGRSKAEKLQHSAEQALADKRIDGHKKDDAHE